MRFVVAIDAILFIKSWILANVLQVKDRLRRKGWADVRPLEGAIAEALTDLGRDATPLADVRRVHWKMEV